MVRTMTASDWKEWLAAPECRDVLETAARIILRQAERIGLPDGLLPCEHLPRLRGSEREDCIRAVAHDVWVFLRTRPERWRERTDIRWLAAQGESFVVRRIGQDYLRHLRDQARTYGSHPQRALYRRLRQVLQEEETIHYRATAQGAFYSLEPDSPEMKDPGVLRKEPYEQWDSPLEEVPAAELHRGKSLVRLARFFWNQAARRMGGMGSFVPVRELVYYLTRHYAQTASPVMVPEGEGRTPCVEREIESVPMPGAEQAPELSIVRSRLEELALRLTASWSERQRTAFVLIHGDGLTLEEAARRMGYRGASGVSYVYRAAVDRLRDFCLLWPGLSPPDLDDEVFDEFVNRVLANCKKEV